MEFLVISLYSIAFAISIKSKLNSLTVEFLANMSALFYYFYMILFIGICLSFFILGFIKLKYYCFTIKYRIICFYFFKEHLIRNYLNLLKLVNQIKCLQQSKKNFNQD